MNPELSLKLLLLVMAAGALGTLCRFLCYHFLHGLQTAFPYVTLLVNVTGALAAGFIYILLKEKHVHLGQWAPLLLIGYLGAFTTFSTFALESVNMLQGGEYWKAGLNILLQNVTGLLAAFAGVWCAKSWL